MQRERDRIRSEKAHNSKYNIIAPPPMTRADIHFSKKHFGDDLGHKESGVGLYSDEGTVSKKSVRSLFSVPAEKVGGAIGG